MNTSDGMKIGDGRWVTTRTLDSRRWIIVDTFSKGDWCGWFQNEGEALAEVRKRNGPHLTVVGASRDPDFDEELGF